MMTRAPSLISRALGVLATVCGSLGIAIIVNAQLPTRPLAAEDAQAVANAVSKHLARGLTFPIGAELPPEMPGFRADGWDRLRRSLELSGMAGPTLRHSDLGGCPVETRPLGATVDHATALGPLAVRVRTEQIYACKERTTLTHEHHVRVEWSPNGRPEITDVVTMDAG